MSFTITNISSNPLVISDGKLLAPSASRDVESLTKRDRGFETRGWLRILKIAPPPPPTAPEAPKAPETPKEVEKPVEPDAKSSDDSKTKQPATPEKKEGGKTTK